MVPVCCTHSSVDTHNKEEEDASRNAVWQLTGVSNSWVDFLPAPLHAVVSAGAGKEVETVAAGVCGLLLACSISMCGSLAVRGWGEYEIVLIWQLQLQLS